MLADHSSLVRQMLAYNTGTIVGGGLILATILSTFCQSRWTLRPIVLLGLIFLTLVSSQIVSTQLTQDAALPLSGNFQTFIDSCPF